jgi:hypothetical protein
MPHDDDYELSDEEILAGEERFKKTPEFSTWRTKHELPKREQEWLSSQPREVIDHMYRKHPNRTGLVLAIRDAMREEKRFKEVGEFLHGKKAESILAIVKLAEQFEVLAKKEPKLDPKANVRNRGTVCVPASSAKDKKDHFPINSISQGRNALARVHQYSKVPSWYKGSLESLQNLVSRKVHSKYPSIKSEKKKSS